MKKRIFSIAIVLAMIAVLAAPMLALAAETGTTVVQGTLGSTINVTAPSAITFSSFAVGTNNASSLDGDCVVTGATNWTVTAEDLKSTNTGFMTKGASNTEPLGAKLQISKEGTTYAAADTGVTFNNPGTDSLDLYVRQTVGTSDVAGTYTITITFTGAVTN